ncbi:hypothetical protein NPIL_475521 [Nephila pilipes]|uniref:Uncharacterized protein n=1 Tax=Nephila pilipes TaxID=299642 RepID=A0A8X6QMH9_NEPPI|nr:hypothetical protein NPIL_475521 [Nephila pilipes]
MTFFTAQITLPQTFISFDRSRKFREASNMEHGYLRCFCLKHRVSGLDCKSSFTTNGKLLPGRRTEASGSLDKVYCSR